MAEFKKKLEKPRHTYVDATEASHIYLLPNSLTAGNLFFGFLAILRCIQANYATDPEVISNNYKQAVWFIFFGVIRGNSIDCHDCLCGKAEPSLVDPPRR